MSPSPSAKTAGSLALFKLLVNDSRAATVTLLNYRPCRLYIKVRLPTRLLVARPPYRAFLQGLTSPVRVGSRFS